MPLVESLSNVKNQFKDFGLGERQKEIMYKNDENMAIAGDIYSVIPAFYIELRGVGNDVALLESLNALREATERYGVYRQDIK